MLWLGILSGAPEWVDSFSGPPEWMDSSWQMLATPINNTLYGCTNWRLAKANTNGIEPDTPEPDALEENAQH